MVESSISGLKCLPPQRVRDLTCTRAPLQVFRSFEFFHFFLTRLNMRGNTSTSCIIKRGAIMAAVTNVSISMQN